MGKYKDGTGGFKCAGEFYNAVKRAGVEGYVDSRLKTAGRLEESDDSQGGFLVPETWADGIFHLALEDSIVRSRATVLPCPGDSLKIRTLIDSNRSSSIFGGITFSWVSERGSKTTGISKPAVGLLELTPHKYVGLMRASNELEADYGAFGSFMEIAFGQAIRFLEDDFFIWGTGAGQPEGIMNSGLMIQVARATAGALDWADFSSLASRLLPDSWNRAVWLINPIALDDLLEATSTLVRQTTVWDASTRTIFNRPVIITEKCSALGTQGDVILADFGAGHYVIADKELEISASSHVNSGGEGFLTDETFWRVVLRTDGQTVVQNPITPLTGGTTVSPFVSLTTSS